MAQDRPDRSSGPEKSSPARPPEPEEQRACGPADVPSQAEGDRETVEEDLRIQEERESGKSR